MTNSNDREFSKSFPRPFLMNALQYLTNFDISAEQEKKIINMNLEYLKNCAVEELKLIDGMISILNNLEEKG